MYLCRLLGLFAISILCLHVQVGFSQVACVDEEIKETFGYSHSGEGGVEADPQDINCVQTLKAVKGTKLVQATVIEYWQSGSQFCLDPSFALSCTSSNSISIEQLGGGSGSLNIETLANGVDTPGGEWQLMSEGEDGSKNWSRETQKIINVTQCAKNQDCLLQFRFIRTVLRSPAKNANTVFGLDLAFSSTEFVMTHTAWEYLPQDATDTAITSSNEVNGKTVEYTLYCPHKCDSQITLELSNYEGLTTYRPGSASNYGTQPNTSPDYVFEEDRNRDFNVSENGLAMTSKELVDVPSSMVAKVTSLDYGGVAVLRAKMQVDGEWVYAESYAWDEYGENLLPRATCAVAPSDERPFVQIPIDTDCNWIADSWEKPKAQEAQLGDHFPTRYWDDEKDARTVVETDVVRGDGYGAYDEYRGFHALNQFDQDIHIRTDAAKFLDQFFWDPTSSKLYRDAIAALIEPRLSNFVRFHRVSQAQATETNLSAGNELTRINFRSEAPSSLMYNYAIHFHQVVGQIYANGRQDPLADSGTIGKSGRPITVRQNLVDAKAGAIQYDTALLNAIVIAHELGHRFNLKHYMRFPHLNPQISEQTISQLGSNEWALHSTNWRKFYVFNGIAWNGSSATMADSINLSNAMNGNEVATSGQLAYPSSISPSSSSAIFEWTARDLLTSSPTANPPGPLLVLEIRKRRMMDWGIFGDATMASLAAWEFSSQFPNDIAIISLNKAP